MPFAVERCSPTVSDAPGGHRRSGQASRFGGQSRLGGWLLIRLVIPLLALASLARAEPSQAHELLRQALYRAELYNWAGAAPQFFEAERLFLAAGDKRNALQARLGGVRANIERERRPLHAIAAQLARQLDTEPLLRTDKRLRMFCLIVKGDISTEIDTKAMRRDWEQVQVLAREIGDSKWENRALAQLGLAAFYEGNVELARKSVGTALLVAAKTGDAGAQIRYLTALGVGLASSQMYDEALPYLDNALRIAMATPDSGYPFTTQEVRAEVLAGLGKLDEAQRLAADVLERARQSGRDAHSVTVLLIMSRIAKAKGHSEAALSVLEQAVVRAKSAGLLRLVANAQGQLAQLYRERRNLDKAAHYTSLAAAATQASGDVWAVPQSLLALAELQISQGRYLAAARVLARADAFVDAMIHDSSSVQGKTALIRAASDIYTRHFSLLAEHLQSPARAYALIERVRGRVATDELLAGSAASREARRTEQAVSRLRLQLMAARSSTEVRRIADRIFAEEQARLVDPEVSILKARSRQTIGLRQVQRGLDPSTVLLEYVLAEPRSYCLVVTRRTSRIVGLPDRAQIERLVGAYLQAVKDQRAAKQEARQLHQAILQPIQEVEHGRRLVAVRDGQLHLVPFDALLDAAGRFVVETHSVVYAPSATSFHLLMQEGRTAKARQSLLAVGGLPYSRSGLLQVSLEREFRADRFADLPASGDEIKVAQAALRPGNATLLTGREATESAFKRLDLAQYRTIHLAVHGSASERNPQRAALVLLSDPAGGEDGFLQASEVVQLRLDADLVVLSACETAVGPLQGQEGIATLSRAFLLAGARAVVSTLWPVSDSFSLFLMKRFYAHLAAGQPASAALTMAKRDVLRQFGDKVVPYQWAGFALEGASGGALAEVARR